MKVWHCFNEDLYWEYADGESDLCPVCGDFREVIEVDEAAVKIERD